MDQYCVNKNAQANGDHEVHAPGCSHMPAAENRIDLGLHTSCHGAVIKARHHFRQVDGCYHCSPKCHTG